jgi:hypothetical protein
MAMKTPLWHNQYATGKEVAADNALCSEASTASLVRQSERSKAMERLERLQLLERIHP